MLAVNQQKLSRVKSLISEHSIKPHTMIKILHDEIMDMKKIYTLKEILEMINFELDQEIKYANFQRILHRMKEKEVIVTKKPVISEQEKQSVEALSINHDDININDLI